MSSNVTEEPALAEWKRRQEAEGVVRGRMTDISVRPVPDAEVDIARERLTVLLGGEVDPARQLAIIEAERSRIGEEQTHNPVMGDRFRQLLRDKAEVLEAQLAREARQKAAEAARAAQEEARVSEPVLPLEARVAALEAALRRYGIPV